MVYWFKRKFWQIKNVFKWLPVIWNQYDFDYVYSVDVFKFQLEKQADYLDSDKSNTLCVKNKAKRIRMILRLMDKVYCGDYELEYIDKFEEIYGKGSSELSFVETENPSLLSMKRKYELTENEDKVEEMNQTYHTLFLKSVKKQKRAHKLLWDLIEHNIQSFWD